jgi:hypothetical protein
LPKVLTRLGVRFDVQPPEPRRSRTREPFTLASGVVDNAVFDLAVEPMFSSIASPQRRRVGRWFTEQHWRWGVIAHRHGDLRWRVAESSLSRR